MIVGVKYCGGCNTKYDRRLLLQKIKSSVAFDFVNVELNIRYDILLVLCGCSSCCADYSKIEYKKIIIVKEDNFEQVINDINEVLYVNSKHEY